MAEEWWEPSGLGERTLDVPARVIRDEDVQPDMPVWEVAALTANRAGRLTGRQWRTHVLRTVGDTAWMLATLVGSMAYIVLFLAFGTTLPSASDPRAIPTFGMAVVAVVISPLLGRILFFQWRAVLRGRVRTLDTEQMVAADRSSSRYSSSCWFEVHGHRYSVTSRMYGDEPVWTPLRLYLLVGTMLVVNWEPLGADGQPFLDPAHPVMPRG